MTDAKDEIKIEDTNLALYGSKGHKDWAFEKASLEEQYKGAGQDVGVEVWRVKNLPRTESKGPKFGIVKVSKEEAGTFYSGDSYIVLHTYEVGGKKAYDLYFWLGKESSQDEVGVAAYKTVALDDLLGDVPVQHREVDGHESDGFLSLFKRKFNVLKGGFASGFTKVKAKEYKPRLLQMKGSKKSNVVVREVDCKRESLNEGDSFVLDLGLKVYIFQGKSSGAWEKHRAKEAAMAIKHGPERENVKDEIVCSSQTEKKDFWDALGGVGTVVDAIPDDKKQGEEKASTKCVLWKFSDEGGSLKLTKVSSSPKKSDVTSDDVFLLDLGSELAMFIGSNVSVKERAGAFGIAKCFIKANKMPAYTPVSRSVEGKNDANFFKRLA